MTKRGKRSKALPVFDNQLEWGTGDLVDESLSDAAQAIIADLAEHHDGDLQEWFKERLGSYRAVIRETEKGPARHEEIRHVRQVRLHAQEMSRGLNNLPPSAEGYINGACFRKYGHFFNGSFLSDLMAKVTVVSDVLEITEQKLEAAPTIRGVKPKFQRDGLLADTADKLRQSSLAKMTKRRAAALARVLLVAAGVEVPEDIVEIEKLIRRAKRGKKSL
ncbi:hypothetical protein [Pseudomonas sp. C32]|uniref:hypothetical protein n=1 Tax=Pseudomonas sp. C32 TaxID=1529208 RepID=UPI002612E2A7|nr:hypothetical protein [Pseudomonas sp. C32]MDN4547192.1 hypothetical protein [Pseudomonas sp. C32]